MKPLCFLLCLYIISSCTLDVELKPLNSCAIFNDGNSKMWLVDHLWIKQRDYSNPMRNKKDIIVFFESGRCSVQKLNTFGIEKGDIVDYKVIDKKILILSGKGKVWKFKITKLTQENIELTPMKGTSFKYVMNLVPITEP
jgi:hypothetical protein